MPILTSQHNSLTSLAQLILFILIYLDHFRQLSTLTLFAHAYIPWIVIIMQSFPSFYNLLIPLREQAVAKVVQGMF